MLDALTGHLVRASLRQELIAKVSYAPADGQLRMTPFFI
jgi:hypothetical protein